MSELTLGNALQCHLRSLPTCLCRFMCLCRFGYLCLAMVVGVVATCYPAAAQEQPNQTPTPVAHQASFNQQVHALLTQHCVSCHNADQVTSGVRVDQLSDFDSAQDERYLKLWQSIAHQLSTGKMPPPEEPQPTAQQRDATLAWIEQLVHLARSRPQAQNGQTRRLTVDQYRHTLAELLGLNVDLTRILPPDAVSRDGFLNNQETLQLSPLLLEAYFQIAEQALERVLVDVARPPLVQRFRVELGQHINSHPCPDQLILGANSHLLPNTDFKVEQLEPEHSVFSALKMDTRFRFIEGYAGNDTVRDWREYDSIYHAVFACMRGSEGYPKGQAYSLIPEGLLLRPAIPSVEEFEVDSTYGPKANFKISLRQLPSRGRFRVTVTAACYDDGMLLDADDVRPQPVHPSLICQGTESALTIEVPHSDVYRIDIFKQPPASQLTGDDKPVPAKPPAVLQLQIDDRHFAARLDQPGFIVLRLTAGTHQVQATHAGGEPIERIELTRLVPGQHAAIDQLRARFEAFERRVPQLGVHVGLRRDCGSTLTRVGSIQPVRAAQPTQFIFEGEIEDFPSPDVEKDNVNYLAGLREIGVRSEYTDGRDMPRMLIHSVEFEGPVFDQWPPTSHTRLMLPRLEGESERDYARRVLNDFARRAWRRPLSLDEQAWLMRVFDRGCDQGVPLQRTLRDCMQVILTSPQFLFLIENSFTPEPERLDDFELASKLAYFLWNGPPDQPLLELAEQGQLHAQLDAQLERMQADQRIGRFIASFVTQWLALDKFHVLEADRTRFPKLTRDTRSQLAEEPLRLFEYLLKHNRPLRELFESDMVLANDAVANYYDLGHLVESGFEFVPVKHQRRDLGGLLTQAAILAGLSDGRDSNPIKRGAWLARKIIDQPPDDPPPNVPNLTQETEHLPLAQRLELHRNQAGCAQCHAKIDPYGLALEEYDAGGRRKSQTSDARAELPDGSHVSGANDLKRYLVQERIDQVAFSFMRHLTVYACGRDLSYYELEILRQRCQQLHGDDYRLGDLLRCVIGTPMFLEK